MQSADIQIAFDAAPIGLVLSEGRVIRACNEAFATLVGYSKNSLVGQSFRMFYGSDAEFEAIRDIGLAALQTSGTYSDERLVLHKDGHTVWSRFRARSLTPDDPRARLVLSYAAISERSDLVQLTPRERQVLGFMGQGMTSKEIAKTLELSPRTIEDIRARMIKRHGVKRASELVARMMMRGK